MPYLPHDVGYHIWRGKRSLTRGPNLLTITLGPPKPTLDEAIYHLANIRNYVRGTDLTTKEEVASGLLDVMQMLKEIADGSEHPA